jgi:hypothetical protein
MGETAAAWTGNAAPTAAHGYPVDAAPATSLRTAAAIPHPQHLREVATGFEPPAAPWGAPREGRGLILAQANKSSMCSRYLSNFTAYRSITEIKIYNVQMAFLQSAHATSEGDSHVSLAIKLLLDTN